MKSDSPEEWELEQRAFYAANDQRLPADTRALIADLWRAYCDAAPADEGPIPSWAVPITAENYGASLALAMKAQEDAAQLPVKP